MPRSTIISFTPVQFYDDLPALHMIEICLVTFLENGAGIDALPKACPCEHLSPYPMLNAAA